MYGLIMIREYLEEILDGKKTYDARSCDTNKRGTIALVDTKKFTLVCLIDLTGTHKITSEEYCKWHATGKWKSTILQLEDMTASYYAYDFANPRRLSSQITKTGRVWANIEESIQFVF